MGSLTEKEIIDLIDEVTEKFTKDMTGNPYSEAAAQGIEIYADTLKSIIEHRFY